MRQYKKLILILKYNETSKNVFDHCALPTDTKQGLFALNNLFLKKKFVCSELKVDEYH